jgi:predicted ribosomally synthesized peptide with SipW-like signal peptide
MKHKKLFVIVAVLVLAIGAAVAYAWWSTTETSEGNTVATGQVSLHLGGQLPINATGLAPQNAPEDPEAEDSAYGCVRYLFVGNTSSMTLMFYGWLDGGVDEDGIREDINVRIWLLGERDIPGYWSGCPATWVSTFQSPGPWLSFEGTLDDLWNNRAAGIEYLSSRTPSGTPTPIDPKEYGVYRVALWLDSDADDDTQNKSLSFNINFTGVQEEGWEDHIAEYPFTSP